MEFLFEWTKNNSCHDQKINNGSLDDIKNNKEWTCINLRIPKEDIYIIIKIQVSMICEIVNIIMIHTFYTNGANQYNPN